MISIGGIQEISLIDFPDHIATTVFLIGCNFRCPWCYNSRLVLPERVKIQPRIFEKDFFKFLKERKQLVEGVCISGGEPTIHKELPSFIKKIKKLGFLVKIDTNGSRPNMIKKLIAEKLVDYVAMDIKTTLKKERYKAVGINVNIGKIKQSIDIIKNLEHYEFRTTCVPGVVTEQDLVEIASYLKEKNANKTFYLQQFQPTNTLDKEFEKLKPYSKQQLEKFKVLLEPFFNQVGIRF